MTRFERESTSPHPLCLRVPKGTSSRVDTEKSSHSDGTAIRGWPTVVWTTRFWQAQTGFAPQHIWPPDTGNDVWVTTSDYDVIMLWWYMPTRSGPAYTTTGNAKNRLEAVFTVEYANKGSYNVAIPHEYPRHLWWRFFPAWKCLNTWESTIL